MNYLIPTFLNRLIQILKINHCLEIKFTFHKFASNILFNVSMVNLFGKSDIFGESMFLEKSNCSIISKCKDVFNIVLLSEIFEFVDEERTKSFEFMLLFDSYKGNFIKLLIIERSKCKSCNDFLLYFDD